MGRNFRANNNGNSRNSGGGRARQGGANVESKLIAVMKTVSSMQKMMKQLTDPNVVEQPQQRQQNTNGRSRPADSEPRVPKVKAGNRIISTLLFNIFPVMGETNAEKYPAVYNTAVPIAPSNDPLAFHRAMHLLGPGSNPQTLFFKVDMEARAATDTQYSLQPPNGKAVMSVHQPAKDERVLGMVLRNGAMRWVYACDAKPKKGYSPFSWCSTVSETLTYDDMFADTTILFTTGFAITKDSSILVPVHANTLRTTWLKAKEGNTTAIRDLASMLAATTGRLPHAALPLCRSGIATEATILAAVSWLSCFIAAGTAVTTGSCAEFVLPPAVKAE